MRMEKLTLKAQEAVQEGQTLARRGGNPSYEPEHLAKALFEQTDGVAVPIVQKIGADTRLLTSRIDEAIKRWPTIRAGTPERRSRSGCSRRSTARRTRRSR